MKQIEDFVGLLKDFTADLAKITPPSDLAAAHATYVDGYQRLTNSLEQIVAALKAKDAAAMLTAAGAVLKVVQDPAVPEAESAIEAALGFSLYSQ